MCAPPDPSLLFFLLISRRQSQGSLVREASQSSSGADDENLFCPFLDFDKRVNDNKTAAEEALKKIPAITRTIAEANNKTRQAEMALGNAAADAREAKAKADDAEKIASSVQKVSPLEFWSQPSRGIGVYLHKLCSRMFGAFTACFHPLPMLAVECCCYQS